MIQKLNIFPFHPKSIFRSPFLRPYKSFSISLRPPKMSSTQTSSKNRRIYAPSNAELFTPEKSFDLDMSSPFGRRKNLDVVPMNELYPEHFAEVKKLLLESGLFCVDVVDKTILDYYRNLGLNEYYFATSSPQAVAEHIKCVIAANVLHKVSHADFFPLIHQKFGTESVVISRASLYNRAASQNYAVEKLLEKEYLHFDGQGEAWRLQGYRSVGSLFDDPTCAEQRLRTCFLQVPQYPNKSVEPNETDLSNLVDVEFWSHKQNTSTSRIFGKLNTEVVNDHTGLNLFVNKEARGGNIYRLDFAFRRTAGQQSFYSNLGDIITMYGMFSLQKHVEPLANGVTILTCFIHPTNEDILAYHNISLEERVDRMIRSIRMRHVFPNSRYNDLCLDRTLQVFEAAYCHSAAKFIFQFSRSVGPAFVKIANVLEGSHDVNNQDLYAVRMRLKQSPFSEETIFHVVRTYPEIAKRLFVEFRNNHHPTLVSSGAAEYQEDAKLASDIQRLDCPDAPTVFNWFRTFNKSIKKTNFFKDDRLALAFRCDPTFLPDSDFSDRPYAVVFFAGNQFKGFHARFADVARGGIRVVQSFSPQQYHVNSQRAFDEVYRLSHTQNFKNKDIPEGGSKGVILLDQTSNRDEAARLTRNSFMRYMDSFLDILLSNDRVVDRLSQEEVCFCGPDEFTGTGGLMDWAAQHAKVRGAWFWRAFTTGKSPVLGGIPHDTYGMTTTSVEAYVKGSLQKLGLTESEVTKCQTGGPDGDLGANSILMSSCKLTSLVDGAGVIADPNGLDREELLRLVKRRFDGLPTSSMEFDATKLSPQGFRVAIEDRDVVLPDGTLVPSGLELRNEFHLNPLSSAILFNPCGGRPESVTPFNLDKFFNKDGSPRFKIIVEGANVFITQDARVELERRGIILFKDASTNKGGVTSSSLEVLAALSLPNEQFEELMSVKENESPPEFYRVYVEQVKEKILENAEQEFEVLWREGLRTGIPRCQLTDLLSAKIIQLKTELLNSPFLWKDLELRSIVLHKAVPHALMPGVLSLEKLSERVPEPYLKAIFSSYLASRFYYSNGLDGSSFAFLEFAQSLKGQ